MAAERAPMWPVPMIPAVSPWICSSTMADQSKLRRLTCASASPSRLAGTVAHFAERFQTEPFLPRPRDRVHHRNLIHRHAPT